MKLVIIVTCAYLLWQIVVNLPCNFRERDREVYIIRTTFTAIEIGLLVGQIWLYNNMWWMT